MCGGPRLESDGLDEERQLEAMGPEPDMESLRKEDAQRKEAELVTQLKALKPNLAALEEYVDYLLPAPACSQVPRFCSGTVRICPFWV